MAQTGGAGRRSDRDRIRNITYMVRDPEEMLDTSDGALSERELVRRRQSRKRREATLARRRRIRRKKRMIAVVKLMAALVVIAGLAAGAYILRTLSSGQGHDRKGMTALEAGDTELAVKEFKEAVSYDPDSASFLTHLGMAYISEGSYEEALGYFTQADGCAQTDEEKILLGRGRGIACLYQGTTQDAIEAFDAALSYEGEALTADLKKDILYYKAEACEKAGEMEEAVEAYSQILSVSGDDAVALMKRGLAREEIGDDENAEADLNQAIKKSKKSYAIYKALYQVLMRQGKTENARAVLNEALTLAGSSGEDLYYKGSIYLELGNTDQAMQQLEASYAKGYIPALAGQGEAAYLAQDYDSACGYFEKFFSGKGPSQADVSLTAAAWNQYALCLIELEKYEEAVTACQNGLELGNREADQALRFNLAAAYEKLLQWEDAYAVMKAYQEKYPGDEKGTHEFEFLQSRVSP